MMIIVTGATGQLGHAVVERLLDRLPAGLIGVSVRDPKKAQDLEERGVQVRRGDFEEPSSLTRAFAGASQVLIVSGPAESEPHRAAIEAAKAVHAKRILYTSHMGANLRSPFQPMRTHAETEQELQASGIPFTSLRNGFYATTAIQIMGGALHTGRLAIPVDGPVSWTGHADLAEAAAIALTREGLLDGITPPLTGPQALDFADIARIASELTGREITRVAVSSGEWTAGLVSHGVPEADAAMLLGMFAASRQGEFAAVDPALADLLGHEPATFRDVLAAALPG
jgi:NAD(P)H dehydrogenase (quinone)